MPFEGRFQGLLKCTLHTADQFLLNTVAGDKVYVVLEVETLIKSVQPG